MDEKSKPGHPSVGGPGHAYGDPQPDKGKDPSRAEPDTTEESGGGGEVAPNTSTWSRGAPNDRPERGQPGSPAPGELGPEEVDDTAVSPTGSSWTAEPDDDDRGKKGADGSK